MKILGSIVLFNPDEKSLHNLQSLIDSPYFEEIYIADNSYKIIKDTFESHIIYKPYFENKGIAYALKDIMEYAKLKGYDYVLTLDQDSIFPFKKMSDIYKYLCKYINTNVGIVALNYNNKFSLRKEEQFVKKIITSGNFINVHNYSEISGFNDKLFIDYVDFDLCCQFFKASKKIVILSRYSLIHTIGNPVNKKFLFFKIRSMNASEVRYYYRFRNLKFLSKKNKMFYLSNNIKEHISIIFMLLCEKNRRKKLLMVKLGKKDAKKGILGKY